VSASKESAIQFSDLSPSILEREDRLRVGRQILAILENHIGTTGLGQRRVLDVGCSSGIITSFLAAVSGPTVGVDIDTNALRIARADSRAPNLEFKVMSGSTLDFPSDSFDVVICNQVYYWLEDPKALMSEIYRVLRPGGACFFASVNKYRLWEVQYRLPLLSLLPRPVADALVRLAGKGDSFGCHYLSFWQLRRLCSQFTIRRYTGKVLKDPDKFKFAKLSAVKTVTRAVPLRWLDALEPFLPNFVWVLEKPRSG
jgi:SAM-dependent methyltransferase